MIQPWILTNVASLYGTSSQAERPSEWTSQNFLPFVGMIVVTQQESPWRMERLQNYARVILYLSKISRIVRIV